MWGGSPCFSRKAYGSICFGTIYIFIIRKRTEAAGQLRLNQTQTEAGCSITTVGTEKGSTYQRKFAFGQSTPFDLFCLNIYLQAVPEDIPTYIEYCARTVLSMWQANF